MVVARPLRRSAARFSRSDLHAARVLEARGRSVTASSTHGHSYALPFRRFSPHALCRSAWPLSPSLSHTHAQLPDNPSSVARPRLFWRLAASCSALTSKLGYPCAQSPWCSTACALCARSPVGSTCLALSGARSLRRSMTLAQHSQCFVVVYIVIHTCSDSSLHSFTDHFTHSLNHSLVSCLHQLIDSLIGCLAAFLLCSLHRWFMCLLSLLLAKQMVQVSVDDGR
jgi:hypothetical protein